MRSAMSATTARSCEISSRPMRFSSTRSRKSSRICCLQHDVERGGRLVGDQQLRLQRAGDRDDDALALAAGKLVRIARQREFCLRQPDAVEHLSRAFFGLAAVGAGVPANALGDLLADRLDRVERRHRLLENHADVVAAQARTSGLRLPTGCRCRRSARGLTRARHAGSSRMTVSAVIDLPEPDSPTSPITSPGPIGEVDAVRGSACRRSSTDSFSISSRLTGRVSAWGRACRRGRRRAG